MIAVEPVGGIGCGSNRRLTVHLQQATLPEALDMVMVNGAGYAWKIEGDTLFVRVFEERIYQFDYLDMAGETVSKLVVTCWHPVSKSRV